MMAPVAQYLATKGTIKSGPMKGKKGLGRKIASCSLWAPACTVDLFNASYHDLITTKQIERFALYTLTDDVERDDHCAHIYNKSLLYLVSNAFEDRPRIPLVQAEGEPILGMSRFVKKDAKLKTLFKLAHTDWIESPNGLERGNPRAAGATSHGAFDDDKATIKGTMARILGVPKLDATMRFDTSPEGQRDRREALVEG
jgi:hypothetical protein